MVGKVFTRNLKLCHIVEKNDICKITYTAGFFSLEKQGSMHVSTKLRVFIYTDK